jgi:hypothetical protein
MTETTLLGGTGAPVVKPEAHAPLPNLSSFLEDAPPYDTQAVAVELKLSGSGHELVLPSLSLYCHSKSCEDVCFFDPFVSRISLGENNKRNTRSSFARYICRHCTRNEKVYALRLTSPGGYTEHLDVMKYGEDPLALCRSLWVTNGVFLFRAAVRNSRV